jgi:hypothetical protein
MSQVVESRSSQGALGAALRILMRRHGVAVEDAFELLVRAARRSDRELRDVALQVVQAEQAALMPARRCRLQRAYSRSVSRSPGYSRTAYCRATRPATPTA